MTTDYPGRWFVNEREVTLDEYEAFERDNTALHGETFHVWEEGIFFALSPDRVVKNTNGTFRVPFLDRSSSGE